MLLAFSLVTLPSLSAFAYPVSYQRIASPKDPSRVSTYAIYEGFSGFVRFSYDPNDNDTDKLSEALRERLAAEKGGMIGREETGAANQAIKRKVGAY